jgi:hypothetical protein
MKKDSEKIRPHSVSSISNSFDHLLMIFTGTTCLLSPSVVGHCFNMKWQPLEVALTNVHG